MKSRAFLSLWLGGTLASTADLLLFSNLTLWIITDIAHNVPWVTLAASGVTVAATLPVIALGPTAGVVVDRLPKRRVVLWADAGRMLAVCTLVLLASYRGLFSLPRLLVVIYGLVLLASICAQFFGPARFILFSQFVAPAQRVAATALSQTTNNIVLLFVPTAAPLVFIWLGPVAALLVTALLYGSAYLTIWMIPKVSEDHAATPSLPLLHEFRAGMQHLLIHPTLRSVFVAATFQVFGGGMVNAVNVFFILQVLGAPLTLYGLTATTTAVGAIVGSSLALLATRRISLLHLYAGSYLATSIGLLIYSRITSFVAALILTGVFGIFQGIVAVPLGPLIMNATPPPLLGRIFALFTPWQALCLTLGTAIGGVLATVLHTLRWHVGPFHFGSIDSVITLGAIVQITGAIALWRFLAGDGAKHNRMRK